MSFVFLWLLVGAVFSFFVLLGSMVFLRLAPVRNTNGSAQSQGRPMKVLTNQGSARGEEILANSKHKCLSKADAEELLDWLENQNDGKHYQLQVSESGFSVVAS